MYLIPKNIKVKKEIFKGFCIVEIIFIALSLGLGYLMQSFVTLFKIKIFLFFIFPMTTFLLFLPLPNGSNILNILVKFIKFQYNQKKYKLK